MATQQSCGYPLWLDGMAFTGLLGRQYDTGTAVLDSGLSATALTPAGGVYAALNANLKVTAPVSGLTVNVAAGFCCVPSATAQAGGYRFGLMSGGSLTVASNATGSTRKDLVLATVSDVGSGSSVAEIQYVAGTTSLPSIPASSIVLAEVDVTNGASSITTGMITDKRAFVCAPGGIQHIASAAAIRAAPACQVFYENDVSALVTGSGIAGTIGAAGIGALTGQSSSRGTATYNSPGHYRWTCPPGVTTVTAKLWAAGSGGGQHPTGQISGGTGGGYAQASAVPVTPGNSYTLIVGQGGAGGSILYDIMTAAGGNSSFTGDSGASITAYGGPADPTGTNGEAGLSGTSSGSVGSTAFFTGGAGSQSSSGGGGGGGGAGSGGNGGAASGTTAGAGGTPDGGAGGTGATLGTPMAPGGGGGGNESGGAWEAGSGASGQVQLTYTQTSGSVLGLATGRSLSFDGSTAVTVEFLADGQTDYSIYYERESTTAGSSRQAYLKISIDGRLTDSAYCQDTTGRLGRIAATYRTSSAQGSTPSAGTHTVTLTGTSAGSANYTLRVAAVLQ